MTKIDLIIAVKNIEASAKLYHNIFGFIKTKTCINKSFHSETRTVII